MTTITKKILIDTANHIISRDDTSLYSENLRELARIALASLDAEPDYIRYDCGCCGWQTIDDWRDNDICPKCNHKPMGKTELFTAPPAPVSETAASSNSVHDLFLRAKALMYQSGGSPIENSLNPIDAWLFEAERAANKQAEPVSQTYKLPEEQREVNGCWCHAFRPVAMSDMRFVVCPDCGNKRCPKANNHRNSCTGSNEPGQAESAYQEVPQQEDKR